MSLLLLRELRRLAPFGAGGALLAGALGASAALEPSTGAAAAFWLVALVALPLVLGVALVAPDTASGATAFLARLPVTPGRTFAAKLAAGVAWLLPTAGLAWALRGAVGPVADSGAMPFLLPVAFGAGAVASVAAHRVAGALAAAPVVLVAVVGLAVVAPLLALQIAGPLAAWPLPLLGAGIGAGSLAAAYAAFRHGDRHRVSLRPAAIASAGVALVLCAAFTTAAGAQAWVVSAAVAGLSPQAGFVAGGERALVPLAASTPLGVERRVASLDAQTGALEWLLPLRHVGRVDLEPNGSRALIHAVGDQAGWLVDLERRAIQPLAGLERDGPTFVVWCSWGPLRVRAWSGWLWVHDPVRGLGAKVRLNREARAFGVDPTGRLLLVDREGIAAASGFEAWGGSRRPTDSADERDDELAKVRDEVRRFAWPAPVASVEGELTLSPSGRHVVWVGGAPMPPGHALTGPAYATVFDLETGRRTDVRAEHLDGLRARELDVLADGAWRGFQAAFSPDERWLAFERSGGQVALVDLARGTTTPLTPPVGSPKGLPIVWSPDGSGAWLPSGLRLEPRASAAGASPWLGPDALRREGPEVWAAGALAGVGLVRSGPAGGLRVGDSRPLEGGAR